MGIWTIRVDQPVEIVPIEQLTFTPNTLYFHYQTVDEPSDAQQFTITNSGTEIVSITSVTATNDYSLSGPAIPASLDPGEALTFDVIFTPTELGARIGEIHVGANGSDNGAVIGLVGVGGSLDSPSVTHQAFPTIDGGVSRTVFDKLNESIAIEDFGGGVGVLDNTVPLRNAALKLAALGGGTINFKEGTYNFASAVLGGGGVVLPSNVTLRGRGKDVTKLVVTGGTSCYFFLNEGCKSNQLITDLTVHGNGSAGVVTVSGPGGFYYCSVLAGTATANVENIRFSNVRLENFGGDFWIRFFCTHPTYKVRNCGMDWDCEVKSFNGNSRDPTTRTVPSYIIELRGDGGTIEDCFVRGLSGDLEYVKSAIALFGDVRRTDIARPNLRNTFQGYAVPDSAAYAIALYDSTAMVTGTVISHAEIEAPFSCGIYTAGSNHTEIIAPHIWGQVDTNNAALPKGAFGLNGPNNMTIIAPNLHDNANDWDINGISTLAYSADMNLTIIGGYGKNATNIGIQIKPSVLAGGTSGIKFVQYRGISTHANNANALAVFPDNASPISFEMVECEFASPKHVVNLNKNGISVAFVVNARFRGCRITGDRIGFYSFAGLGHNSGRLTIDGMRYEGASAYHLVMDDSTDVEIIHNRYIGAVTGHNNELEGTKGEFFDNHAENGTTLVEPTANALGHITPTWTPRRGKRVQNAAAAPGDHVYWEGDGTAWRKVGILDAARCAAQANSSAADVAALVTDFNALLTKLRTANLLAP